MKNITTSSFFSVFFLSAIFLVVNNQATAQEYDIYELQKENPSVSKSAEKVDKSKNRTEFYDLYQNLHPTIFVENNSIKKVYGDTNTKRLYLMDAGSINFLTQNKSEFNDVRLITLKLKSKTDLSQFLDLSSNPSFKKLKYVFINCYFKYSVEDIQNFIKVSPNVRVFHVLANPS